MSTPPVLVGWRASLAPGPMPGADVQEPKAVCTAKEGVGQVQDVLDKATDKGQQYGVLGIGGEGFFDWQGLVAQKQVKVGDNVCLRVGEGQYPRVYDLEKLPEAEFKKAEAPAPCLLILVPRLPRIDSGAWGP